MTFKRKQKLIVLILSIIGLTLSGCSTLDAIKGITSGDNDTQSKFTESSRQITMSNPDEYKNDILKLIQSGEKTSKFSEEFEFNDIDLMSSAEIKQYYYFNNSVYLQISNKYMYRFQLNDSNEICSYIKYSIVGQ